MSSERGVNTAILKTEINEFWNAHGIVAAGSVLRLIGRLLTSHGVRDLSTHWSDLDFSNNVVIVDGLFNFWSLARISDLSDEPLRLQYLS